MGEVSKERIMVVYIDVFFALNFCMDLIILLTVRKISGTPTKLYRNVLAAIAGAVYACFILIQGIGGGIIEGILTYIVMSSVMALISFGCRNRQKILELITMIFVVTFALSGMTNLMYSRGMINSSIGIVVSGIAGAIIIVAVFSVIRKNVSSKKIYVRTRIVRGDNHIEVKALVDTGNCLSEPLSRKPVAVLSKEAAERLKKGDETGIFIIPYKSVGMEHGILEGFMADYMEITKEESGIIETKIVRKPILAEYAGKFTENNHYQMLLHPEMMEEGDGNVWKKSDGK